MRIIAASDLHHKQYYVKWPKGDMLILAGDFTYRGEKIERILTMEWLRHIAKKYKYVVIIVGNHDINMTKSWYKDWTVSNGVIANLYWLQDDWILLEGYKIYGSPYTVRFGEWGFGEPEDNLALRFNHIPKDTDILITHGPAYSILDVNKNGQNCGSTALYNKIKSLTKLKLHIFGHIHEGYGKLDISGTTYYNVSILDEYYKIAHRPTIIDIGDK